MSQSTVCYDWLAAFRDVPFAMSMNLDDGKQNKTKQKNKSIIKSSEYREFFHDFFIFGMWMNALTVLCTIDAIVCGWRCIISVMMTSTTTVNMAVTTRFRHWMVNEWSLSYVWIWRRGNICLTYRCIAIIHWYRIRIAMVAVYANIWISTIRIAATSANTTTTNVRFSSGILQILLSFIIWAGMN